jgi:hypothetical protein
VVRN